GKCWMTQIVPSAGFTPPCDYTTFAENFDLSLLPGGDLPLSPSTLLYSQSPEDITQKKPNEFKIYTTYYNVEQEQIEDVNFRPDFQKLWNQTLRVPFNNFHPNSPNSSGSLSPYSQHSLLSPNEQFHSYRQSGEINFYPSSPEQSLYAPSPNSVFSGSPREERSALKNFLDETFDTKRKSNIVTDEKPKDHQLLREALRDTSFQKKYNVKPIDLEVIGPYIKMEEGEETTQEDLSEQIARENIEPVLNLAIEQMRKEVDKTCATLGISADPAQWTPTNVFSWIQWTSREFNLAEPSADQWNLSGTDLLELSDEDFSRRTSQGGVILHAQLEIWKAAYSSDDLVMQWLPETASSNTSSGDISDEEDEESSVQSDPTKPSTSRTGSHIHLWQFLKELLQNPQIHGSCIRWLDRSKGIFKIEDSVKVARLWGKRKNRPAMNYDKLSRSIRQYYKKGIMKKTERSQRLVYQFCHPYNS
ncbi:hypothetical protein WA026_019123, partial [Henosepilachna vigintioctopunctata]